MWRWIWDLIFWIYLLIFFQVFSKTTTVFWHLFLNSFPRSHPPMWLYIHAIQRINNNIIVSNYIFPVYPQKSRNEIHPVNTLQRTVSSPPPQGSWWRWPCISTPVGWPPRRPRRHRSQRTPTTKQARRATTAAASENGH